MSKAPTKSEVGKPKKADAGIVATSREKAAGAAALIENNPLAALLGGIVLGAAAGALIPRGEREKALLAPLGERLGDAVQAALAAGREAGAQALNDSDLTLDGLRDQVSGLVSQATGAATAAGGAAFTAARDKVRG